MECPICGGNETDSLNNDFFGDSYIEYWFCDNCNSTWDLTYTLTETKITKDGTKCHI